MNTETKTATRDARNHGLERVDASGKFKYPWLQVTGHFDKRELPWECRDERDGCFHRFKVIDDARKWADLEDLDFYL